MGYINEKGEGEAFGTSPVSNAFWVMTKNPIPFKKRLCLTRSEVMFEKELWELEGVYRKALLELDLEEEEVKPGLLIVMEEMVEINNKRELIQEKLDELMRKKEEARNE